eukprot:366531-Chlamydomonas_euryale.AAC.6
MQMCECQEVKERVGVPYVAAYRMPAKARKARRPYRKHSGTPTSKPREAILEKAICQRQILEPKKPPRDADNMWWLGCAAVASCERNACRHCGVVGPCTIHTPFTPHTCVLVALSKHVVMIPIMMLSSLSRCKV